MKIKQNQPSILLFVCVLCLVFAAPVWSATYYVDINSGEDDPAFGGTSGTGAWKTIHYTISQINAMPVGNYVINMAAGTYSVTNGEENADLAITQGNVLLQGETGVILDGEYAANAWNFGVTIDASNVILRDLAITRFRGDSNPGIVVNSGANNLIEDCDLFDNDRGIQLYSASTGTEIVFSNFYNNTTAILTNDAEMTVSGNKIYENDSGIESVNYSDNININIFNNLFYGTDPQHANGVNVDVSSGSTTMTVRHNTIAGIGNAVNLYHAGQTSTLTANVKYNIVAGATVGIEFNDGIGGTLTGSDYNTMFNCTTPYNNVTPGANDSLLDPLFVDASGFDFHLQELSPARNAIPLTENDPVLDDLDGVSRPQGDGYDMGAYEKPLLPVNTIWEYDVGPDIGYNRLILPDINADGYDELLLYEDYEQIRVISGENGSTELWSYPLTADPIRYRRGLTAIEDLDDDGIKDIIVIAGTSGNGYGENYSDDEIYAISGAISPAMGRVLWGGSALNLGYGASSPVVLSDIDDDGYDDIFLNTSTPDTSPLRADYGFLISGKDGSVLWNYTYNPTTPASSESGIWDVYGKTAAPDLDGDGRDDIVVSGAGGSGGIEAWKGSPSAANIWRGLAGIDLRTPAVVGDANLDGVSDIAVGRFHTGTCPASPDPRLYVLNGQTGSVLWQYGLERTPSSIESLGDVNGDTIEDVVIGTALINNCGGSDSSVYVFDGFAGADDRVLWTYPLTDQNSYVTVVEDADGDGIKDVAVAGQMDSLLLLSGADGSVLDQESFPSGSGAVQPGEFNNAAGGDILTNSGNSVYALSFSGVTRNDPPAIPILLNPADEAVFGDSTSIMLKSSAFSDPEGDAQTGLTWTLVREDSEEPVGSFPVTFTQGPFPNEYQIQDQLLEGLKYTWQVGHKDDQDREVWSEERSFKIGTSVPETLETIKAGKSLGDFGMISIVHWPDNPDPKALFNINYDPNNYRIGAWDPEQNRYIEFGKGLEIEPGRAVWILTRDPLKVNFNGVPVSTTESMEVCLHTHPSTGKGWNMIAPPNAANYLWNEVLVGRFTDDDNPIIVDPVPVTSPVASTLINHRIYEWQNGEYKDHRLDEDFVLEVYKGYWVKAIVEGAYLVFPESAQVSGLSTPRNTMLAWKGRTIQWMKSLLPAPKEAIADNDLPPMPMDSFDGSTNPLFEGCFVQTLR